MNDSVRFSKVIFDFEQNGSTDTWGSVDDRVMGGVSSSEMLWRDNKAVFKGVVSAQNNGGFCSVRSLLNSPLPEKVDHIWIESSGESLVYSFTLRTNRTLDGINYQADFNPLPQFTRIAIPLAEFKAQYRGRFVLDAPELLAQDINQIGIIIADQQYGTFELTVNKIGVTD